MVISFLGVRTDGQTDTVLESSHGNMSAHKKFQLKTQNYWLAVDCYMPPRRSGMHNYMLVKMRCINGIHMPPSIWQALKRTNWLSGPLCSKGGPDTFSTPSHAVASPGRNGQQWHGMHCPYHGIKRWHFKGSCKYFKSLLFTQGQAC